MTPQTHYAKLREFGLRMKIGQAPGRSVDLQDVQCQRGIESNDSRVAHRLSLEAIARFEATPLPFVF